MKTLAPSSGRVLRFLIADDHAIYRQGLKGLLHEHFPKATVLEAETARQALDIVHHTALHTAILDISLPDRSGLDLLGDLGRVQARLPVLVLSAHPEELYALRVLNAGAAGYLDKVRAPRELIQALDRILAGGRYITPSLAERLAEELTGRQTHLPHERLSDREYQILQRIAQGKVTKEIAGELCVTAQTVSTHRARLLKKMGLQTNADLIRYAVEHGLLP
jgi:two-component system, NarL family, invasion response regulator UvrY